MADFLFVQSSKQPSDVTNAAPGKPDRRCSGDTNGKADAGDVPILGPDCRWPWGNQIPNGPDRRDGRPHHAPAKQTPRDPLVAPCKVFIEADQSAERPLRFACRQMADGYGRIT